MSATVTRAALRRSLAQVRHVRPVPPATADGLVAAVYGQLEDDFGMIAPPVALHSPAPGVLAAAWLMLRETLLANGSVRRADKEAVATAVSVANGCPYCVEVHTTALRGLRARTAAEAIGADRIDTVDDAGLRRITAWARATGDRAGAAAPPAPAARWPELLGVATTFHYLNRMVTVFLGDSPLPPGAPDAARGAARWLLARVMRPGANRRPGRSLDLLPDTPLPTDLRWAAANPTIAAAFARACGAIDAVAVPAPVRALVHEHLARWDGRPAGPSRAWVEDALSTVDYRWRRMGRLALLTALAPYQIDEWVLAEVREQGVDDTGLIELAGWASLAAARRISGWAVAGPPAESRGA